MIELLRQYGAYASPVNGLSVLAWRMCLVEGAGWVLACCAPCEWPSLNLCSNSNSDRGTTAASASVVALEDVAVVTRGQFYALPTRRRSPGGWSWYDMVYVPCRTGWVAPGDTGRSRPRMWRVVRVSVYVFGDLWAWAAYCALGGVPVRLDRCLGP